MQERENVAIGANKKDEYLRLIGSAFDKWHSQEWYFQPREEFDRTSAYSFLAYLRTLVGMANEKGQIHIPEADARLREQMGEHFREEKFNRAVWFLREGDWDQIK